MNASKELLGDIAANLSAVNNISLSGFSFQNSDTTVAYKVARGAAVADALLKLQQYILLSGKNS